jgi:hypothetical protein
MKPSSRVRWAALLSMAALLVAAAAQAEARQPEAAGKRPAEGQFLRLARDADDRPTAMETAIVRYAPQDCGRQGPTVDLIAAVHVADKGYYKELNREFEKYDVVLYELIAPEGTRIEPGGQGAGGNPVSALQRGMKNVLDLAFQLDEIDYTPKNLVHADMTPEQFAESMRERGESMWSMLMRMMGYALARQNRTGGGSSDAALLMALFNPNRAMALKRVLAEQFEEMEGSISAIEGPDGSTLIAERNKVALEVLRKQIEAGHQKIAIFYGGGHMSHFQKELKEQFDLVPVETRWLVAWDLKGKPSGEEKEKAEEKAKNP